MDSLFSSIYQSQAMATNVTLDTFLICTITSIILGYVIGKIYTLKSPGSKSFVVTLALLPAIVQLVIMIVNGNIGTGIAVMGAFSLVRFRSIPGTAKEICYIFLAMAIGLATGTGHIVIALIFTIIIGGMSIVYEGSQFGEKKEYEQDLKITIPEDLYSEGMFDDLFISYTSSCQLVSVKTSNMGTLFKLHYRIKFNSDESTKEFINKIRCRNGNLEVLYGVPLERDYNL